MQNESMGEATPPPRSSNIGLSQIRSLLSQGRAVFILGANDPEMREIESLALRNRVAVARALDGNWRVSSRSAYHAKGACLVDPNAPWRVDSPLGVWPSQWEAAVYIESDLPGFGQRMIVDHHNPGDPGWGAGPESYWEASSLGQACKILEVEPTADLRLIAAADHCLTAAYQGQCEGVDPSELLWSRASWKGARMGLSVGEAAEAIMNAAQECKRAWRDDIGASVFSEPMKEVPFLLAEGAAVAGLPILYSQLLDTGEVKRMAKGFVQERIREIMDGWQASGMKVYGNPARGYAGSYEPVWSNQDDKERRGPRP